MRNGLAAPDPEAITLCQIPGMDAMLLRRLVERWETPEGVVRAPASELRGLGVPPTVVARIVAAPRQRTATEAGLRSLQRMGISTLTVLDRAYPERLHRLPQPPLVLYIQGAWPPGTPGVALLSSAVLPETQQNSARSLLAALVEQGVVVIAGGEAVDLLPPTRSLAALPFGLLLARGRVPDALREAAAAGSSTLVSVAPVNAQSSPVFAAHARALLLALPDGVIRAGDPLPELSFDRPELHKWVLPGVETQPARTVRKPETGAAEIVHALGLRPVGAGTAQQERLW